MIFIDLDGLAPTTLEAAYMAKHIYGATLDDPEKGVVNGWVLEDIIDNTDTKGTLKMGVYSKLRTDRSTEYALVNMGTYENPAWIDNAQQPLGLSPDMKDSIRKSKEFVENHSCDVITMVGHSKGGAEAVANAVASNKNAITFNPASAALNKYGLSEEDHKGTITNYVVQGDLLHNTFSRTPPGEIVYLKRQHEVPELEEYNGKNPKTCIEVDLRNLEKIRDTGVANHDINSVIAALEKREYIAK